MNPEQKQAVLHTNGPLLIIAGAGTGKTTTVVEKINHLISQKMAKPEEILALTFTEKAAQEMEMRVDEKLPYGFTQTWISTFHSFADTILRTEISHIGMSPGYRLMSEAETISFLRERLFMFNLTYFRPLGNPNKFLDAMLQHISRLRDEDITPEEYKEWVEAADTEGLEPEEIEKRKELAHMYEVYQDIKVKEAVFDYGDLIHYLLILFRKRPNILNSYRTLFKYVLVDEFQDTNIAQYALIKMLCPPGANPNLTVVGDDSQAIYKFRGASVSNILTFMKDFPTAKNISLLTNYRSAQPILDHSYQLIKNNDPDTLEAQLGISKKLVAGRDEGDKKIKKPLDFFVANRVEEEAENVATQIKTHSKDREYKDFAILVRANSHADAFVNALTRNGIPFHFHGPGSLYKQPEVKDLIAYLNVLADPEDSVSLYRVLSMKILDINAKDIAYLLSFSKKTATTMLRAVEIIVYLLQNPTTTGPDAEIYRTHLPFLRPETKEKLTILFTHLQKAMTNIKRLTAGQLLYNFLEDTGYLIELGKVTSEREERVTMLVSKFFDKLKSYESTHEDSSVHAVVDYLKLSMELGESPSTADFEEPEYNAVHILTVHGSKGLEFPVVFLVNLSSERFPTRARREVIPIPPELIKEVLPQGDYHIQEERRLFYVAMTRAKDLLFLSASRFYGEGKRIRKVSPFVYEALGDELVEKQLNVKTEEKLQLSIFDFKQTDEPELKKREAAKSMFVSYTQIDTYERCPLRYKYQFVLKVPAPPAASASFGSSMHSALQIFYQMYKVDQSIGLDELLEQFKRSWIPLGFASQAHERRMKKEGESMLTKFFTEYHTPNITVLDLEKLFRLKITDNITISGKIDRVDQNDDGSIEIIDYKTGKLPSDKELKDNAQLATYLMAAGDPNLYSKSPADVTLTFYYLQDNKKISMKKTHEDIVKTKEKIINATDKIREGDFKANVGPHCSFCPFKMLCEAWQ